MINKQKEMNKQHEFMGYKFNINVKLFHESERCLNGITWHRAEISNMGNKNWGHIRKIDATHHLPTEIKSMIEKAEKWAIDDLHDGKSQAELDLITLGFE